MTGDQRCRTWVQFMPSARHVQGVDPAGPLQEQPVRDTDWGFATRLPDLKQLLQDFALQSNGAASNNASPATGPRISRL